MSRNPQGYTQQPITPVVVVNSPIPSTDPFMAILTREFLQRNVWLEFFAFTAVWNTLTASATGQQVNTTIDPSIDFIIQQMNLTAFTAAGTILANPDYVLQITETSGRSNMSDDGVHVSNWTGQNRNSGAAPYNLPFPRYIRGNNTLSAKLTNNTATAALVSLAYCGIRVTYLNTSREALFNVAF